MNLIGANLSSAFPTRSYKLEISDQRRREIVLSVKRKTKAKINFAVTAKLICTFVFAMAESRFSHEAARIMFWLPIMKSASEEFKIDVTTFQTIHYLDYTTELNLLLVY